MLELQLNILWKWFWWSLVYKFIKVFLHFTESPESKCIVGSTSGDVTFLAKFLPLLTSLFNEVRTFLNVNVSGYIIYSGLSSLLALI